MTAGVHMSRRLITCGCGRRCMYNVLILEPSDPERLSQTLSEGCPVCRSTKVHRRKQQGEHKRKRVNVRAAMKYYREQLPVASRQSSAPHTEISHVDH